MNTASNPDAPRDEKHLLNDFQVECENLLKSTLGTHNIPISSRKLIVGNQENYIEGKFLNCHFWIYLDGAQINKGEEEFRLEKESYKSLDELLEDFVKEVNLAIEASQ